jgi:hypothetical protein
VQISLFQRSCLLPELDPPTQNHHRGNLIDHVLTIPSVAPGFIEDLVRGNRAQSLIPQLDGQPRAFV